LLAWSADRTVLDEELRFDLSGRHLPIVVCCQHLLAWLRGGHDEAAARRTLEHYLLQLERGEPRAGDMLLIHLALNGLRTRLGGDGSRTWGDLLPRFPTPAQASIRRLAALSPLVRLTVPDLEVELHQHGAAWVGLANLLDSPGLEPLRDHVADGWRTALLPHPERMATFGHRVLGAALDTKTLGGTLLVVEFFRALLRRLCDDCEWAAALPEDADRDQVERRRTVVTAFKCWLFDRDDATATAVFELFKALFIRKDGLKQSLPAEDERGRRLRRSWRELTGRAAEGLTDRPWPPRLQRLLAAFWLRLCLSGLEGLGRWPDAFDGLPEDTETLACRLVAALRFSWAEHQDQTTRSVGLPVHDDLRGDERDEAEELAAVERLIETSLQVRILRDGLLARQVLEPAETPPALRFIPQRVQQLASLRGRTA
jgi:hypothetical protein